MNRERGSATIELVLLAPVFGILLAVVIVVGRVQGGHADIESATRGAARTISMARNQNAGTAQARADASGLVNEGGPFCRVMTFDSKVTDQRVTVDITCQVDLAEASALPIPGTHTVEASSTEVIDTYKEDVTEEPRPRP